MKRSQAWDRLAHVASIVASQCPLLGACHRIALSLTSRARRKSSKQGSVPRGTLAAHAAGEASLVTFTDENFSRLVEEAHGVALVDFWAPWCMPCRIVSPTVERLAEEFGSLVTVGTLNVDENMAVASRYRISGIPTVGVFRDGQLITQLVGVRPERVYREALTSALATATGGATRGAASSATAVQ